MTREEYEKLKTRSSSRVTRNDYENLKKNQSTNANKKVTLALKNGKEFGTVSSNAYRAVLNGTLDYYNPVDNDEKKVLEDFKKWTGYGKTNETPKNDKSQSSKSPGEKIGDSAGYVGEKLGRGVLDGIEGITDFLWSIPLSVGWGVTSGFGLAENKVSNKFEDWFNQINQDDITNYFGSAEKRYDAAPDKLKEWGWLPETVGNIVPFTVETIASGGTTATDDVLVAGKSLLDSARAFLTKPNTHFGLSAAGSATEEAVNKGSNPLTATSYGGAIGALEAASEMLFGGFAGTGIGKTATKAATKATTKTATQTFLKKIWDSPVTKKVFDIAGEAVEEDIVAGATPIFQKGLGVDKNAEWASFSDYVESGSHGVILSLVMNAIGLPIQKYGKTKVINRINESTEYLNGFIENDNFKIKALPKNATEEAIKNKQKEITTVTLAFDNFIEHALQEERKTATEKTSAGDNTPVAKNETVVEPVATEQTTPVATEQRNTFTDELDEIASTEMPTVSVGETFVDSKTHDIIKVIGRNESATEIELTTPAGKKETKLLPNKTADIMAVDDGFTKVETSGTVVAENTEAILQNQPTSDTIKEKTTNIVSNADKSRTVAYTNDNQKIDLAYKVVSADDLIVSNDLDGKLNPAYPQELQPRDRSRVSSQSQINQMANNLNPARLAESTSVSEGAPIVGPDNVVESGNGRTLAIKLAYQTGVADGYRDYIINNAEAYGIDVSNLPEKPVLVRERLTEVDRLEFTRKANESSIGSLSATEQAKVDAERLTDDVLNLLVANDDGIINTPDNRDFISSVIGRVFKNEDLNNVVNAEGKLSSRGLERITNAIFYKAYGDISLSVRLSESLDNDMKNATKVLLNVAPKVVVIKKGIASGILYDFDFSEDIASAVRLFEKCRNENTTVENYASQTSFFEKEPPLVFAMAYVFETKNRGAKQATDFYNLLLDTVIELGDPNQIALEIREVFQTKEEILDATFDKFNTGIIAENTARGIERTKNTLTPPESVYQPTSENGRENDKRGKDAVPGNESYENEAIESADRVQQDNRPSEETGIVTDDEQLRQKNESVEGQSEVTEETIEEKRNKIRKKAKKTGEINLDELGTLTGIPVTHMSDTKKTETTPEKTPEETYTPKAKEDFKVGDVLEFDGEQWECVGIDTMMIDFVNVDKNALNDNMSVILPYELFKEKTDYKVIKKPVDEVSTVVAENETTETPKKDVSKGEASKQIAAYVADKLAKGEKISAMELSQIASESFGGTMANNAFTIKDAYDAMELGVNQHILSMKEVSADKMLELLELLPTQTKRTEEMVKFQQFSTPPSIAYLANYTANVNSNDIMLEPSAGIGGIAVFAKKDGAKVYVNELDTRRLDVLKNMPFDGFFNENAEQLDNILGGKIEPTVIVMNPPFSSSSERNIQNTKIGAKHIEQALKILAPNGRLVAIVGNGMADGTPAFRDWWKDIKSQYNVRANIGINGKNYNKYGTNFDIQMLVIDKNGPTTTETVTGHVDTLQELQEKLGGIRDERPALDYSTNEQRTPATTRKETVTTGKSADVGNSPVSDTGSVADNGKSEEGKRNRGKLSVLADVQSTDGNIGLSDNQTPERADVLDDGQRIDERGELGGHTELQDAGRTGVSDSGQDNAESNSHRSEGKSGTGRNNVGVQRRPKRTKLTDSIFEQYQTQPLAVRNAQPHPGKVSESAAMSAIEPPPITYKPNLSQDIIDKGVVSDVQLEAISYAGQSHSQTLPNGTTRGFFLGDGTGIGKGRTIAGMMLDNYNQGRKKAVWVTENTSLMLDAKRDLTALFGNSDLLMQFEGGAKAKKILDKDDAILAVSYSTLSRGFDNKDSNFEKIVNWLGKDFDGVIVFDEAHNMANATGKKGVRGPTKPSKTGLAGIALQEALPKAKIVYSSATGATEVENLRYAERLGLWGEGTPFITGDEFVSKVKSGGIAAMELVARDLKAMGVYLSRNISYDDVQYDKITHNLTAQQTKIYDELASSWQIVLQYINKALEATNQDKDGHARGRALGAFWSSQQRFFNQILTSMQVPSVISDIEQQLADGKSCVIQLVSTNESAQNQEFERLKAEDLELDEFDLTPKQMLMSLIEHSFPVQQFEEYVDDNGNKRSKPVVDSQGKPVLNRDAVRQRDELLDKLGSIKVPSSPIDMIINHFGTELVAEKTGRSRRVIQKDGKNTPESLSAAKKDADVDAFQNGNKRIMIFSKAGGTGKSYHADKAAKNQQQRVHYLLEAGWQADKAVQGFGRSHRSNQVVAPIFKLVTTNLKGQMRFISTIAKRLDQLGAMTKGQRQAGGQGMFSASDNLESSLSSDVLAGFYKDLVSNRVDGIDDGLAIIDKLGLRSKILDEYGRIIPTASELREVNKFLNRILSLESTEQNTVFEGYSQRLQDATEKALQAGTLDKGLENYKADKITLNEVKDIREDERSGAKTKYYNLTAEHKIKPVTFDKIPTESKSFVGFYKNKNTGNVRAVMQTSSSTDQYGNVTSNYKLIGQIRPEYIPQHRLYGNWVEIKADEAEKLWNEELAKLPEFRKENLHLISGVVLPVWDKLPTENVRIYRVLTSDGEMLIGRVVSEDMIDETLRRLGSSRKKEQIPTKDLITSIKNGGKVYLENDWMLTNRKVSGENRIELVGPSYEHNDILKEKGVFTERIQYRTRYFVPADANTEKILDDILKISPVMRVETEKYAIESEELSDESRNDLLSGNSNRGSNASTRKQAKRISDFKQKIAGKTKTERRNFAKELLAEGQTEEITDGKHQFNIVKEDAYNDDMISIVEEAKEMGKDVGFFIGHGKRKFSDLKIDAVQIGNKVYLRYDGTFAPQTLNKHEDVHIEWDNPEMQKASNIIRNDLSEAEKKKILAEDRYQQYMELYKDKDNQVDLVWQEFVADVFAGMSPYSADYIDLVVDYWYDGKVINRYNPAEYINSIDAGGNATVLDNIGFGDEYRLLESGVLDGYEQNNNGEELGQLKNSSENARPSRVDNVGQIQSKTSNTPHTRKIHRSGVSAEALTSSGLTAEQAALREQNKTDGVRSEFYTRAKLNGESQDEPFNTENSAYYPDSAFERNNISVQDGVASFTEKRFAELIREYSVPVAGLTNGDYAQAYVAYISPSDFLSLTTANENAIIEDTKKYGHLDVDILKSNSVREGPYLEIDFEDGIVFDHNGRHRMVMLRDAGVEKVAVVIKDLDSGRNKYSTQKMTNVSVTGQKLSSGTAPGKVTISEIIPLSPNYRNEVREKFVNNKADIHYSISIDDDIAELTPERKKEIFEQFERDRAGIDKPTQKQIWGERAEWIAHNVTRVFPEIPERGEKGTFFAEFRKMMIQWKALPQTSMFMTQDKLNQMTKDLTPDEFKTFSELVYFLDLQEEAQIQKERGYTEILLPNEITPHEVDQIVDILNTEATDNVKKALDKRRQIWDNLKEQYVTLNQYVGFDVSDRFNRKNYYHHQVIEYMNQGGKGVAKGKDIEIKAGRGWLKERQGSTKATNTDFLAVEYKAMLQMQYDIYVANMLGKIKDQYDIKPQLEKQAFDHNKEALKQIIIEEATDKDGNVMLDNKGKPDSETYRQQQWYNQRIMYGFSGLFDLAESGVLPTFNGQYGNIISALEMQRLNAPGLYNYVGELASMELSETATDEELQAQISARTVLKYTSQKKAWVKEILGNDYQTWETLANDMQDTHSIHQPRRGNYFYTKTTVDEDAFNKAFNDMIVGLVAGENGVDTTADVKKVFEQYSETVRLMGAAYEQWVIPNEIETTMNKVANPKQVNAFSQASRTVLSAWKGWATSVNPLRTVKFGLRNIFGDLDAVIAGNPKVVFYSKQAVNDIYQAMKNKKYSPEFMEWVERGGYSSLIFANEMDTEMQDKLFSHLKGKEGINIFKIPAKIFEGYYNGVESAHNFREAILRYSAYLYFKNDIIKNDGKVKDNVASNRYIVKGLKSVEDKAYQLSKDLLGAYDEVATMGQAIRRHAIPFYSFTETNLKRYYRLFENIIMSDDKIPKKAGKFLLKALMVNMLGLLMVAWNKLVMKDEDEELPPSVRNVPHITLGKIGDDVYAFRQLGSFSELLEWFGLEDYQWTEEDKTAALDKAVGMITPVVKTPVELLTGLNFYPSITQPRAIRDKVEHLFSTLGVDDVYRVVAGKPTRGGIADIAKGAVTYSYDYKESAYYEILDIKREYQGDTDNTIYGQTPKSNALYYMKTAIRYKDKEAALKYLDEYFENGGTAKGITQSIAMLNPLYGYTGKDTIAKGQAFVNSLSDDEKDKLRIAINYYETDLMLPKNVSELLRKKGITDAQAKNLLTKYINSKCN